MGFQFVCSMGILVTAIVYHDEMPTWAMALLVIGLYLCGMLDGALLIKRIRNERAP